MATKKNPTKFNYEYDGKNIELPHFDKLPFGVMRRMRKASETEQAFLLFESAASEKSLAIIDTMGIDEIGELLEAWQKAAGVNTGESEG